MARIYIIGHSALPSEAGREGADAAEEEEVGIPIEARPMKLAVGSTLSTANLRTAFKGWRLRRGRSAEASTIAASLRR